MAPGERPTLVRYLRDYRLTLEVKCAGLDADGNGPPLGGAVEPVPARARAAPCRDRTVLVPAGHGRSGRGAALPDRADPNGDFNGAVADPDVVADAWATWRSEVAFAEKFVDAAPDLDISGTYQYGEYGAGAIPLRRVLVHMIEEYARHMGHADFLRERIDGRVGQ